MKKTTLALIAAAALVATSAAAASAEKEGNRSPVSDLKKCTACSFPLAMLEKWFVEQKKNDFELG